MTTSELMDYIDTYGNITLLQLLKIRIYEQNILITDDIREQDYWYGEIQRVINDERQTKEHTCQPRP